MQEVVVVVCNDEIPLCPRVECELNTFNDERLSLALQLLFDSDSLIIHGWLSNLWAVGRSFQFLFRQTAIKCLHSSESSLGIDGRDLELAI